MNRRTHRNFDLEVGESVTFDLLGGTGATTRSNDNYPERRHDGNAQR